MIWLGMNAKGEVRSASEFKEIFLETGHSYGPYRCPFCEVFYDEECVVEEGMAVPQFKLAEGQTHGEGCNGEFAEQRPIVTDSFLIRLKNNIDLPDALVVRHDAMYLHEPDGEMAGLIPNAQEIERRRNFFVADHGIFRSYSVYQLGSIVRAYKILQKYAYEQAISSHIEPGSDEYKASFRRTLNKYPLSLYGHRLTYGIALQSSKLHPWYVDRIYHGTGLVQVVGNLWIIRDVNFWPKQARKKSDLIPFEIKLSQKLFFGDSPSHGRMQKALEYVATTGLRIEWYAYGLPQLRVDGFELRLNSLDHFWMMGPP